MAAELGGRVQDEDVNENNFIVHQQGKLAPPTKAVHSIRLLENTTLRRLVGADSVMVNSFHRQAVREVPPGFRPAAVSDDGVVEAMESADGGIVLGLQFHPEIIAAPIWDIFFRNLFREIQSGKKGGKE
jgi:putative glutamine amidotransferase